MSFYLRLKVREEFTVIGLYGAGADPVDMIASYKVGDNYVNEKWLY